MKKNSIYIVCCYVLILFLPFLLSLLFFLFLMFVLFSLTLNSGLDGR
ncbi:MAG: hypothetical protein ACR2RF_03425 [Geminicoccaceae bacterium]